MGAGTLGLAPDAGTLKEVDINVAVSGDTVLLAGVSGQRIKVYRWYAQAAGVQVLTFKGSGGAALRRPFTFASGAILFQDYDTQPWFMTAAGEGLTLGLSANVQLFGCLYYLQG